MIVRSVPQYRRNRNIDLEQSAVVEPHYTKPGRGRRPLPLETMLRVYFLQQRLGLSDPQAEDMLYDSKAMRRFARVELGEDMVPDESTIPRRWTSPSSRPWCAGAKRRASAIRRMTRRSTSGIGRGVGAAIV